MSCACRRACVVLGLRVRGRQPSRSFEESSTGAERGPCFDGRRGIEGFVIVNVDIGHSRCGSRRGVGLTVSDVEDPARIAEIQRVECDEQRTRRWLRDADVHRRDHNLEQVTQPRRRQERAHVNLTHDGGIRHRSDLHHARQSVKELGDVGARPYNEIFHRDMSAIFFDEGSTDVEEHCVKTILHTGTASFCCGREQTLR